KVMLTNGISEPFNSVIWNNLLDETSFLIHFYANDSANNENSLFSYIIYKDTLAPIVVINAPANSSYWNSEPTLNIAVFDSNFLSMSYSVMDFSPIILLNNTNKLFNSYIWSILSEDEFFIKISAIDKLGNINSINLTLYKDTTKPEITINFPHQNELFGTKAPPFNISVLEKNLDSFWYTLIGDNVNISFTDFTGSINQTAWERFDNGTVTIRFYTNDTAGNLAYQDITLRKDIYAPVIIITYPGNNQLFGVNSPNFMIYKSGHEIEATWYTLDNGQNNFSFTGLNVKINQDAWDDFGFGTIPLRIYINNSLGKIGTAEINLRKDPNSPIIYINNPLNQTAFSSAPLINITVIEPNLDTVWYTMDDSKVILENNSPQYLDNFIWENLPQGTFILLFYANDTLGNINIPIQLYLLKDTIGPNITIIIPNENQRVDRTPPFFELTVFDDNNVDLCWYVINDLNMSIFFTGTVGRINTELWETIWDNKTQGSMITIRFYAMDKLGNINYKEINLIKYESMQLPKLFSNPLGFIFSTIGLGILVPTTIKLNKSRYYQRLDGKAKNKLKKVIIAAFLLLSVTTLFYIF
ncbi:MAG: hypothetical protein ACFE9Z_07125, partial [Promethearchaeota archaeon]